MSGKIEKEWDRERIGWLLLAVALTVTCIGVLNYFSAKPMQTMGTAENGKEIVAIDWGKILVDYSYQKLTDGTVRQGANYFSCQNFMWLAFFIGLGEVVYRHRRARAELAETDKDYLPDDETTLLTSQDLVPIYKRARKADPRLVFPKLIRQLAMQYRKSGSADQSHTVLSSSLDLHLHAMDLKYTIIRYAVWIIPTLGFLGTVIGIADAMNFVGSGVTPPEELLGPTTYRLAVAFYTTLVALIQSGFLVLLMNLVQGGEERALNHAGQHCLENLINRLITAAPARSGDNS